MKKLIFAFLGIIVLIGCVSNPNTPMTAFIVKNTSDKTISFDASVVKYSQSFGRQILKNTFTVNPNDSIIARQTYFKKDSETPQNWFVEFNIFPVDNIEMNDPKNPENWIKSTINNTPVYIFTLNKELK